MKPNYAALIKELPAEAAKALQQLRVINSKALGGVSIADNLFAEFVELPFVHGDPIQRPSPLRGRSIPKGFEVIAAWDSNNNAIPFPTSEFDENFEDSGEWRLTFYAPAPYGICLGYRAAALSIASDATVAFDTVEAEDGAIELDTSTGVITCAKDGFVQYGVCVFYNGNVAGTFKGVYVNRSGSTTRYGITRQPTNGTNIQVSAAVTNIIPVSAGETILTYASHDVGAATGLGVSNERTRFSAQYVSPPIGYSGTVLGIMWGG